MYFAATNGFSARDYGILGTIDMQTGKMDSIGKMPAVETLACDNNGQLFAMGGGFFYKINKTDAKNILIGAVELPTNRVAQAMDFDHDSNELYWASDEGFLAKISILNGKALKMADFAKKNEFSALYIPCTSANDGAPAMVSELKVAPGANGALSTTIDFSAPSKTVKGENLTSLSSIEIFRNEEIIKTFSNPTVGSPLSFTDHPIATGVYKYKIIVKNSIGIGIPAFQSVYVGEDKPGNISNLVFTTNGSYANLTWIAPTQGFNGGWFNASQLTYKITRYPENIVVAENVTGNSFTDNAGIPYGKNYYGVQAKTTLGYSSLEVKSNSILMGDPIKMPYFCDFLTQDIFDTWTVLDVNANGETWHWDEYNPSAKYDYASESNDWLLSPPLRLQAATPYLLQFDIKAKSTNPETIKIYYGKGKTPEAQTPNLLMSLDAYTEMSYTTQSIVITPKEDETYYLGFHVLSAKKKGVSIRNVKVNKYFDNDLSALSLKGRFLSNVGNMNICTVKLTNAGRKAQSKYRVELIADGKIVAFTDVNEIIQPNEIKEVKVNWIPDTEGKISVIVRIILEADEVPVNNETEAFLFDVKPASDKEWISINDKPIKYVSSSPIAFGRNNSLSQSIYTAAQLDFYGSIEKVVYFYNNQSERTIKKPIRIHMATTPHPALSKWLPENERVLVFDDSITLSKGEGSVEISLAHPYLYSKDNLVILVAKEDIESFKGVDFIFHSSNVKQGLVYAGEKPADIGSIPDLLEGFAHINIQKSNSYGFLKGVVTFENKPIKNARVTLKPFNTELLSDSTGAYEFLYLPQGSYSLHISTKGYEDTLIENINIAKNQTTIQDIKLSTLKRFNIAVKVQYKGQPIENANIQISGYESISAKTDVNGESYVSKIYKHNDYIIKVAKEEFALYKDTFNIVDKDISLEIHLLEAPYAPQKVSAQIEGTKAQLTWGGVAPLEFRYDDGIVNGQRGFLGNNIYQVIGTVYKTPTILTQMSWYTTSEGGPHDSINVFVVDLDTMGKPIKTILFNQMKVPNKDNQWSSFQFPIPVECPNGFMIAISYAGFMGLGTDAGTSTEYPFMLNTHYNADLTTGEFIVQKDGFNASNFLLRANGYEIPSSNKTAALLNSKTVPEYKIWRLNEDDYDRTETWTLLTTNPINVNSYSDTTWGNLPKGAYVYAVKSIYDVENISAPTFSNMISKGMTVKTSITVKTDANISADGAQVTLVHKDGRPQHIYTAVVKDSKVVFDAIWKGKYSIKVSKNNYITIEENEVDITSEIDLSYELKQVKVLPFNLAVESTGDYTKRKFNWNVSPTINEDFESHKDFAINTSGKIGWSYIDADGARTGWIGGYENIPNGYLPKAYMVLNPGAMTPSMLTNPNYKAFTPHSGKQMIISLFSPAVLNEDYIISPKLNFSSDYTFSFWGRAFDREERMRVGYSTTGKDAKDFIWTSPGKYVSLNPGSWIKFAYTIPYSAKYVTIEYISNDAFVFMVDDIFIGVEKNSGEILKYEVYLGGEKVSESDTNTFMFTDLKEGKYTAGVKAIYGSGATEMATLDFTVSKIDNEKANEKTLSIYPNPVRDILQIEGIYERLEIYNLSGKGVLKTGATSQIDVSSFPAGSYIIKVYEADKVSHHKLIKQ